MFTIAKKAIIPKVIVPIIIITLIMIIQAKENCPQLQIFKIIDLKRYF